MYFSILSYSLCIFFLLSYTINVWNYNICIILNVTRFTLIFGGWSNISKYLCPFPLNMILDSSFMPNWSGLFSPLNYQLKWKLSKENVPIPPMRSVYFTMSSLLVFINSQLLRLRAQWFYLPFPNYFWIIQSDLVIVIST